MSLRRLLAPLALVALVPLAAEAQFTTFVAPPERVDTVVVVDTVGIPAESLSTAASIANMKAWVDSAAGDAVNLREAMSTGVGAFPDTTTFPVGAPAPNTATPLPLLLLLGTGSLAAGAVLLRRQ